MLYISKQYFKFMECICKNIRRDIHKKEIHTSGDLSGGGEEAANVYTVTFVITIMHEERNDINSLSPSGSFLLSTKLFFFFFFSTRIV